jgi:hypothetical protein
MEQVKLKRRFVGCLKRLVGGLRSTEASASSSRLLTKLLSNQSKSPTSTLHRSTHHQPPSNLFFMQINQNCLHIFGNRLIEALMTQSNSVYVMTRTIVDATPQMAIASMLKFPGLFSRLQRPARTRKTASDF